MPIKKFWYGPTLINIYGMFFARFFWFQGFDLYNFPLISFYMSILERDKKKNTFAQLD